MHDEERAEVMELDQEKVQGKLIKRANLHVGKSINIKGDKFKGLKRIQIGSRITLLDLRDDSTSNYTIVKGRTDDSNVAEIKISESSPLARALMGMTAGITIEVSETSYRIISFA